MDINDKIKLLKERVKSLTSHFNYDEEVINILTICYIAITSIDKDIEDILEEVLSTKYILLNDGSFNYLLKEYYPNIDPYSDTYQEPSFDNKKCYKDDFIILNVENFNSVCDIFDAFLHEIKHAMNSIIKRYKQVENNNAIFYCGLCSIDYYYQERRFLFLEEAFNSFMTRIYLRQIEKLKKIKIEDRGISKILKRFSLREYEYSYYNITHLLEPLFCDKEFFNLFYNAALYKEYEPLYQKIKIVFGEDIDYFYSLIEDYYYDKDPEIETYLEPFRSRRLNIQFPSIKK